MVRPEFGLDYFDGPTIERLGLVILALLLKQSGEVVVTPSNVGMILAENLFIDLDRPTNKRLGLVILALLLKQSGEVVMEGCNVGMILAVNLLADLDRPTKERLGLVILALLLNCRRSPRSGSRAASSLRTPDPRSACIDRLI
jgi:hypothetical protein